jgi:hypothetical protein
MASGHPLLGERGERRPAGIAQPEQLGGLVEGLARSVVLRFAEQGVAPDAVDPHELGVPARHQQGDEREARRTHRQQRGQQMPLEVMDADGRDVQREREGMREGGAHQQGAGQAGTLGVADALELPDLSLCNVKNPPGQRHQAADMVPRGELGDDPAVGLVHGNLGMHGVREQAPGLPVIQGDARLVAGGLDPEEQHGH